MKIAVTGASGFVGSELVPLLQGQGHSVLRFVRRRPEPGPEEAFWNPQEQAINENALRSCDAVIHLAGANIGDKRWTTARKKLLEQSRIDTTAFLARTLANLDGGPRVLICASAIGFYGDRGDAVMDEESAKGSGFLSDLCAAWEGACGSAREAGIRVVNVRVGMVIGSGGGALAKMLLPFKLGFGGRLGSGKQWMSWIDRTDLARVFAAAVENDDWSGVINAVSPECVTNSAFTRVLGRVLGRPTLFPAPGFMLKLALGEMAGELLLASTRVKPARLEALGFTFERGDLEASLRHAVS